MSRRPRRWAKASGSASRCAQHPAATPSPARSGNFYWTGAWGTTFWVDPAEKLIAMQMIQVPLAEGGRYRRAFRNLVYQAMVSPE